MPDMTAIQALKSKMEEAMREGDEATATKLAGEIVQGVTALTQELKASIQQEVSNSVVIGRKAELLPGQVPLRRLNTPALREAAEIDRCAVLTHTSSIYLDWNVIVRFQKNEFQHLYQFIKDKKTLGLTIPYSADHIREASSLDNAVAEKREHFLNDNLSFISSLTDNLYLDQQLNHKDVAEFRLREPIKVLQILQEGVPEGTREAMDAFLSLLTPEATAGVRCAYGFDPIDFSTIIPEDVVEYINRQLVTNSPNADAPKNLLHLIYSTREYNPQADSFDLAHDISGCFKLLDLFGYRPEGKNRERAAFLDASHAGMASFTDCLITDDARLRDKARVAYSLFGIATSVIDASAAEKLLSTEFLTAG